MEIMTQLSEHYQQASTGWANYLFPAANKIFATLAMIEIAWAGCWWALEKNEITSLLTEFLNKIILLGLFYALLLNANHWIPAILKSFMLMGAGASKINRLYPSDIFDQGIGLATTMMSLLAVKNSFLNSFAAVNIYIASYVVIFCYTLVAAKILVAQIETYIIVSAGIILLGFSASQVTRSISVNYFSYAINLGIRLFILFLIVGIGSQITLEWIQTSQKFIVTSPQACFEIIGGALIFLYIVWVIPSHTSGLMTGMHATTLQFSKLPLVSNFAELKKLTKTCFQSSAQKPNHTSIKTATAMPYDRSRSSQSCLKNQVHREVHQKNPMNKSEIISSFKASTFYGYKK